MLKPLSEMLMGKSSLSERETIIPQTTSRSYRKRQLYKGWIELSLPEVTDHSQHHWNGGAIIITIIIYASCCDTMSSTWHLEVLLPKTVSLNLIKPVGLIQVYTLGDGASKRKTHHSEAVSQFRMWAVSPDNWIWLPCRKVKCMWVGISGRSKVT